MFSAAITGVSAAIVHYRLYRPIPIYYLFYIHISLKVCVMITKMNKTFLILIFYVRVCGIGMLSEV